MQKNCPISKAYKEDNTFKSYFHIIVIEQVKIDNIVK
jgi:hypothetical protein